MASDPFWIWDKKSQLVKKHQEKHPSTARCCLVSPGKRCGCFQFLWIALLSCYCLLWCYLLCSCRNWCHPSNHRCLAPVRTCCWGCDSLGTYSWAFVSAYRSLAVLVKEQSYHKSILFKKPCRWGLPATDNDRGRAQHTACFYENIFYLPFQHFLQFGDVMAEGFH